MCWLSWFSGPRCCSCPGFRLRLGASDCSPGLAFCFMAPLGKFLDLLPAAPLPPMQKRDAQHMFYSTRGHTPKIVNESLKNKVIKRPKISAKIPQNKWPNPENYDSLLEACLNEYCCKNLHPHQKRLQMKIWGFIFAFAFVMERQSISLDFL